MLVLPLIDLYRRSCIHLFSHSFTVESQSNEIDSNVLIQVVAVRSCLVRFLFTHAPSFTYFFCNMASWYANITIDWFI